MYVAPWKDGQQQPINMFRFNPCTKYSQALFAMLAFSWYLNYVLDSRSGLTKTRKNRGLEREPDQKKPEF